MNPKLVLPEANILNKIIIEKKEEIKQLKSCRRSLKEKLTSDNLTLIAEIKKASPSKGLISSEFNPARQLAEYIKGGAGAVSILTDKKFFQGSKDILSRLRDKTQLPILRKDFLIDPLQIYESFFAGADIVLLISTILTEDQLAELLLLTANLGMEALVEVHSEDDLKKAITVGAEIIGINNRDLNDFSVSLQNTAQLVNYLQQRGIRDQYLLVAESGIKARKDIIYLRELAIDGVLIGETLMKTVNPAAKIKELFS